MLILPTETLATVLVFCRFAYSSDVTVAEQDIDNRVMCVDPQYQASVDCTLHQVAYYNRKLQILHT